MRSRRTRQLAVVAGVGLALILVSGTSLAGETRKPLVVLFDVNTTLIKFTSPSSVHKSWRIARIRSPKGPICEVHIGKGPSRRALNRAIADHFGPPQDHFGHTVVSWLRAMKPGMTDFAMITRAVASTHVSNEAKLKDVQRSYLEHLGNEIGQFYGDARPGAWSMVLNLREAGHAVGLATGALKKAAKIKLQQVSFAGQTFWQLFPFGGFGDNRVDLVEVVRTGAELGAMHLGKPLGACEVVIVGGLKATSQQLASQGVNARHVGVANGKTSQQEKLRATGAVMVPTLDHPSALPAILGTADL